MVLSKKNLGAVTDSCSKMLIERVFEVRNLFIQYEHIHERTGSQSDCILEDSKACGQKSVQQLSDA